jgi:peptidoglycan/LPS O-acetylase OafA/YrhL
MSRSKNIQYLGGLDDIRGFAALLILLYHGAQLIGHPLQWGTAFDSALHWFQASNPLASLIVEGHTAVGLFLFISGFVFSFGTYGREVSLKEFLRNRVLRIYPLYLFVLFFGSVVIGNQVTLIPLLQSLLMFHEYPGSLDIGYIGGVFWSVCVEWKCYLLFPFLHRITARRGLRYLMAFVALIVLMRLAAVRLGTSAVVSTSYFALSGHLDQFCVGMIIGYRFAAGGLRWTRRALPLSVLGVLLVVFAFHRNGGYLSQATWKVAWPTVEALSWGLVVVGYVQLSDARTVVLRPLRWLGIISYSIYMLHYPVLTALVNTVHAWPFRSPAIPAAIGNTLAFVFPVVVVASTITYFLIEKPAMDLRRAYVTRPPKEAASVAPTTAPTPVASPAEMARPVPDAGDVPA